MSFPHLNFATVLQLMTVGRCVLWLGLAGAQVLTAQEVMGFYIREYRVEGARRLKNLEVEEAVYPFLGPGRTPDDVEKARATLEKVYHDKGFQTVSVLVPPGVPAPVGAAELPPAPPIGVLSKFPNA